MRLTSNWAATLVGALALAFVALLFVAPPSAAVPAGKVWGQCVHQLPDKTVRSKAAVHAREFGSYKAKTIGKIPRGKRVTVRCENKSRTWVLVTAYFADYGIWGWAPKNKILR